MSAPISTSEDRSALLAALALQLEWGVDTVLSDTPLNRFLARQGSDSEAGRQPEALPRLENERSLRSPAVIGRPSATSPPDSAAPLYAATIEDFITALRALRTHPLARTATHAVTPVHVPGSRLMIIGEVPQDSEDRTGVVLSGPENALFPQMIAAIGLSRDSLSLAPAIPWRPPGGRDVSAAELQFCRPLLHCAIRLCRPERLLLLGQTPARLLLGEGTSLTQVRGRWLTVEIDGHGAVPVLATRHPMQLSASPRARRDAWQDLLNLAEILDSKTEN